MSATDSTNSWRSPAIAVIAGGLVLAVLFYGCRSRREVIVTLPDTDVRDVCSSLLDSGLDMARPQSLGLIGIDATLVSTPAEAAEQFTQWLRRKDCQLASPAETINDDSRKLLERLLGHEGVESLLSEQVDAFDAAHVRDALLDHSAAQSFHRDGEAEIDRVLRMFDHVVRSITLRSSSSNDLPLTVYEARLFGTGTAETRAWAFANLLRQLRIDAVVLRPATTETNETNDSAWWVAALMSDGIFLFDPELGLPVPADPDVELAGTSRPRPATWSSVVENPALLVDYRMAAGLETPAVEPRHLLPPRIELIGPSSFWSTAMERMELSMTGDRGVLLYDPLHETQAGLGLVGRVARAGKDFWNVDAISIWSYPDEVRSARYSMSDSQRQRLAQRLQPFLGPVEPHSRSGELGAHRRLWQTRVDHLAGNARAALGVYMRMRLRNEPHPAFSAADVALNELVGDEAAYWLAQAQFDVNEPAAALETLELYLAQNGDRSDEARGLRVLALAADGQIDEAISAVADIPEATPGLPRLKWLADQWTRGSTAGE